MARTDARRTAGPTATGLRATAEAAAGDPERRRHLWWASALLVAATVAAYWNSFQGTFVFDDICSIRDNLHLHKLWPPSEAISLPLWKEGIPFAGRPVSALSFAVNRVLCGAAPWGYHLGNLLIHLGAGLLLFGVARRTFAREPLRARFRARGLWIAAAIALLWLVHPLTTAAVTYIVQRCESMMALFYLLTLYACIRGFDGGRRGWFVAGAAACALGMGTKEVMFTAPVTVFLYDATFVSRSFTAPFRRRWPLYAALTATWGISVGLFLTTLPAKGTELHVLSPTRYLMTQAGVILQYLGQSVWPHPLVMDYNWPAATAFRDIAAPGAVIVGLVAVTVWGIVRRRWFGFVGAWFFLILAPTSSIVPIPCSRYDHRMYLSLAAVVTVVVLGGYEALFRMARRGRAVAARALAAIVLAVVAGTLAFVTHARNQDYRSNKAFWTQNLRWRPTSFMAQNGLGVVLLKEKRWEEAARHFRETIRLTDAVNYNFAAAHLNLGNALMEQGNTEAARSELEKTIQIVERDRELLASTRISACNSLATLCLRAGDWQAARAYYEKSLAIDPDSPSACSGLGVALAYLGDPDAGLIACRKALQIRETLGIDADAYEAYDATGRVLMRRGRPGDAGEALACFQRAVELEPLSDGSLNNLGNVLYQLGRRDEAMEQYRRALVRNPRNTEARNNLGMVLKRSGAFHEAEECFRKSIEINPDAGFAYNAHANLGACLLAQGDPDGAIAAFERALGVKADCAPALNGLGEAYATKGAFDKAVVFAERALKALKPQEQALAQKVRGNLERFRAGQTAP